MTFFVCAMALPMLCCLGGVDREGVHAKPRCVGACRVLLFTRFWCLGGDLLPHAEHGVLCGVVVQLLR